MAAWSCWPQELPLYLFLFSLETDAKVSSGPTCPVCFAPGFVQGKPSVAEHMIPRKRDSNVVPSSLPHPLPVSPATSAAWQITPKLDSSRPPFFFFLRSQTVSVKNLVRVQGKSLTSVQLHLELQLEKLRMMQQLETGIFWGHLHPLVVGAGTHRSGSWCWQSAGTLTGVLPCAIFRDLGFFTARLLRTPVASVPVNRGKAVSSFPSRLWNYHAGFHWLQASRKPTQIREEDIDPNFQGSRVKQFAIFYFWLPHLLTPSLKGNILNAFKSISS